LVWKTAQVNRWTVDVGLGGEIRDGVDLVLARSWDEAVSPMSPCAKRSAGRKRVGEVGGVAGVGEASRLTSLVSGEIFFREGAGDEIRADKAARP